MGKKCYYVCMSENTADLNALATGRNFVWHELYAANTQKSIDFYTAALDFGVTVMDMGPGGSYTMLTRNGHPICGVIGTEESPNFAEVPPHWATYLAVADVDASLVKCIEHGAKVVVPAMDVPTVGRMALIQDPQCAHIWIFTPEM
jgi:predicted enzyme related to lactoylglutathione lyase